MVYSVDSWVALNTTILRSKANTKQAESTLITVYNWINIIIHVLAVSHRASFKVLL